MSHEATLRAFAPADLPALHRIRAAAFAPVFASFRTIVGEEIAAVAFASAEAEQARDLDEICADGSAHELLVAMLGDERIVGFVALSVDQAARTGEIGLNAVDPGFAGRGIGTAMYEAALARMKALGAVVATVGTGGDASHAAARRAYAKAGFGPGVPSVHLYRLL